MWSWFLGLVYGSVTLKWAEMKINDGWGCSHLHRAIVYAENSPGLWAPRGPVTSVPKPQLFAESLQTCVILKEFQPDCSLAR